MKVLSSRKRYTLRSEVQKKLYSLLTAYRPKIHLTNVFIQCYTITLQNVD